MALSIIRKPEKLLEYPVVRSAMEKLNYYCDYVPTPPVEKPSPCNVLIIHAHPQPESLSNLLLNATKEGLLEAGHSVRVRRLYYNAKFPAESYHHHTFHATLNPEEYKSYVEHNQPSASDAGDENLSAEVREAIDDLRWCNAIVFVYPTWWQNFPAILKGYFDRILLPGVAFKPDPKAGSKGEMVPLLTHIKKVAAVTTYQHSFWKSFMLGDNSRRFLSNSLRSLLSPNCQLLWRGIYGVSLSEGQVPDDVSQKVAETKDIFKKF